MSNSDKKINIAIAKYQIAIDKNVSESGVLWDRFSAMLIFNSILITAIGLSYQKGINLPGVMVFLPIVGLITCYLWLSMTYRCFKWIEHWIESAREIERSYLNDKNNNLNPVLNGNQLRKRIRLWPPRTKYAAYSIIVLMGIIYIFLLYYSLKGNIFNISVRQTSQMKIQKHNKIQKPTEPHSKLHSSTGMISFNHTVLSWVTPVQIILNSF